MEQKKYNSIVRHGKTATHETVKDGSKVVVWEKLDGANASFKLHEGEILCYSRNNILTESDGLRGFYQWVHEHINKDLLAEGLIYYGEWLVPHKIDYGENFKNFFLFDVYSEKEDSYLSLHTVISWSIELNIDFAPIIYHGVVGEDFTFEDIQNNVGKSVLSVDGKGEGVVIKNYDFKYRDGSQMFTKIVTKEFQESNGAKVKTTSQKADALTEFIGQTVTENRVEKLLMKLVDEGKLKEDYDITDMGTILKELGSSVADDVIKEELDELIKVVKGRVGRVVPNVVKKVLEKNGRM